MNSSSSSALLAVGLLLAAGCAKDDPSLVRLRLTIEPSVTIPAQIDGVRVRVVASRTSEGELCTPVERVFPLSRTSDLPLYVDYFPGAQFDFWVAFRVEWLRGSTVVAVREKIEQFPSTGMKEIELRLETACLERPTPCLDTEQCIGGLCVGLDAPGPFITSGLVVTDAGCDPEWAVDAGSDARADTDADADAGP
jgi:hypothetical protein